MTKAEPPEAVTVRSVARAAGVSIATVSRVMAGSAVVSEERTQRVLQVARDLGYRPDPITAARCHQLPPGWAHRSMPSVAPGADTLTGRH
ncbi:LacI family DNA-binding transcriptional regulator [Georgenia sp. MJ173]|uniref:LacI family DNA-binding transcriptional regulator n=1 Tax=Georgenia sunbinii TaxID=3117728 RepID=UPI002F26B5CF